jgi:hypothetical protein
MRENATVSKRLLTTREVAERLSVSIFTVRNLAEFGALPVVGFTPYEQDPLPQRGRGDLRGVSPPQRGGVEVILLYVDGEGGLRFADSALDGPSSPSLSAVLERRRAMLERLHERHMALLGETEDPMRRSGTREVAHTV